MEYPLVKALIDLDAIRKNIWNLKQMTCRPSQFMAVVKANGYGHGAVKVAETAVESGADCLGVARLDEALELRRAGIDVPILIFGYIPPVQVAAAIDLDLTVTVYDLEMARGISRAAAARGKTVKTHLKVDTGMGRVGMIIEKTSQTPSGRSAREQILKKIMAIKKLPGIDLEGMYTHFAAADSQDKAYTRRQIERFASLREDVEKNRLDIKTCHAANSAGIIEFPESHFDMVRAGISIYGLYPSKSVDPAKVSLVPAMTLTSMVTAVRTVPKGFYVSYGMTHKTQRETQLASVPIGYADGFSRQFSNRGVMLVNGHRAPIVGRVCMDQTMIDVGGIPDVAPGDDVVLIGSQGKERLGADDLADRINTINYEIVSALTPRVKRIYSHSNRK